MPSLKRYRTNSPDSSRVQKRSCSDSSYEAQGVLTRNDVPDDSYMSEASVTSMETLQPHVSVPCVHKRRRKCSLWMDLCCACADKRPISSNYLVYVDGVGNTEDNDRAAHYCDGCRGAWYLQSTKKIAKRKTPNSNQPETSGVKSKSSDSVPLDSVQTKTRSFGMMEPEIVSHTIRVTCVDRAFDLVRADYPTFDELRKQVAQLLWCDPRELIAIASDIDMEIATEHPDYGLAAFSSHASCIHFRMWQTEDVDMDDA